MNLIGLFARLPSSGYFDSGYFDCDRKKASSQKNIQSEDLGLGTRSTGGCFFHGSHGTYTHQRICLTKQGTDFLKKSEEAGNIIRIIAAVLETLISFAV